MSYKLAYWCWEVVVRAVIDFAEAFSPDTHQIFHNRSTGNPVLDFGRFLVFEKYKHAFSPEMLQEYDKMT